MTRRDHAGTANDRLAAVALPCRWLTACARRVAWVVRAADHSVRAVVDAGTVKEPLVSGPASEEIAGLVRRCREEAGLTQTELANRMGSTQSMVARWEKGGTELTFATLERLARALGRELTVRFGAESRP